MTESRSSLVGFEPVQRIAKTFEPQSFRVPAGKEDLIIQAANLLGALWDCVENGLSPSVSLEVLKVNGDTICRISPFAPDGVTKTVANPGDWIAIDGSTLRGMNEEEYAEEFTKDVPIEWDSVKNPPVATAEPERKATIVAPLPISANRPFNWTARVTNHNTNRQVSSGIVIQERANRVYVRLSNLVAGNEYSGTLTVATQYKTSATSVASNRFTAFDQPGPPPDVNVVEPQPVSPELQMQIAPETVPPQEISEKKNGADN